MFNRIEPNSATQSYFLRTQTSINTEESLILTGKIFRGSLVTAPNDFPVLTLNLALWKPQISVSPSRLPKKKEGPHVRTMIIKGIKLAFNVYYKYLFFFHVENLRLIL